MAVRVAVHLFEVAVIVALCLNMAESKTDWRRKGRKR